jgi:hypothetical protein
MIPCRAEPQAYNGFSHPSAMTKPPPRIALIHATALAVEPIQSAFSRHWPQARLMNVLDDSLSMDRAEAGQLTPEMFQRFVDLAQYAVRAGSCGILFTCSAFGPAIEIAGKAVGLPTLKPNEAMFEQALRMDKGQGVRVGLIATFEASIASMSLELLEMAKSAGCRIQLETAFVPAAMQDLAQGRAQMHHDKIAKVASQQLRGCDIVLLAQFSMAAALPTVHAQLNCPVLSSPDCAVLAMQKIMNHD